MMTLIWLACVMTTWTPASGAPDGYHTELAGVPGPDVATNEYIVCIPEEYVPTELRVQGFNADGSGPWSHPLLLKRVHDFDAGEDDGVVGWPDFGKFITAFGDRYKPNGVVIRK